MKPSKSIISSIALFWLFCFVIGYFLLPKIFPPKNSETILSKSVTSDAANELTPFYETIDPTEIDILSLETYYTQTLSYSANIYDLVDCNTVTVDDSFSIESPYNILSLLNKQHKISEEFVPFDLVDMAQYKIPYIYGPIYLRAEAADHFNQMYQDMTKAGFKTKISSGWRSLKQQQRILDKWIARAGKTQAFNYAAKPGHSEHHLGTAIDILTVENGYTIAPNYFNTKTFKWLSENSYKYGFLLSYPQGKQEITGYNPEGWHYRYVGVETATIVHNKGVTLAEYLLDLNNICY